MKTFEVIVPIIGAEVYLIEAENAEEAVALVQDGEVDACDTWWDADYDSLTYEERL